MIQLTKINKEVSFHRHCKCGTVMEKGFAISWRADEGITYVYYCDCGRMFINYEDKKPKWLKI